MIYIKTVSKKIKNFRGFNEGLEDDLSRIEDESSKTFQFSVERSGFDPDFGENVILIDFRTSSDWYSFSKLFSVENSPSMILIKNYKGEIKKYSVCDILINQIESWVDSGMLQPYDDSFIIGFQLDLGGGNIKDFLLNPREDDGEGDYEEYDI